MVCILCIFVMFCFPIWSFLSLFSVILLVALLGFLICDHGEEDQVGPCEQLDALSKRNTTLFFLSYPRTNENL